MFNGHQLYTLGDEWVFDLTEFIGYKVTKQGEKVQKIERAFSVSKSNDHQTYNFTKYFNIPLGIMRKARDIIEKYLIDALILAV